MKLWSNQICFWLPTKYISIQFIRFFHKQGFNHLLNDKLHWEVIYKNDIWLKNNLRIYFDIIQRIFMVLNKLQEIYT